MGFIANFKAKRAAKKAQAIYELEQNGLVSREVDKNWKITEKGKDFLSSNKIE